MSTELLIFADWRQTGVDNKTREQDVQQYLATMREEDKIVLDLINSLKAANKTVASCSCDNSPSVEEDMLTNNLNSYRLIPVKKRTSDEVTCDSRAQKKRKIAFSAFSTSMA